jgi:hypothetical protein
MVVLGLLFLLGPALCILFMPDAYRWAPFSQPYEHLTIALYASLGICLLIASKDPPSHIIMVDFTILSSILAGGVLTYNALFGDGETIHLFFDIPLLYLIALVLILLYPRKLKATTL